MSTGITKLAGFIIAPDYFIAFSATKSLADCDQISETPSPAVMNPSGDGAKLAAEGGLSVTAPPTQESSLLEIGEDDAGIPTKGNPTETVEKPLKAAGVKEVPGSDSIAADQESAGAETPKAPRRKSYYLVNGIIVPHPVCPNRKFYRESLMNQYVIDRTEMERQAAKQSQTSEPEQEKEKPKNPTRTTIKSTANVKKALARLRKAQAEYEKAKAEASESQSGSKKSVPQPSKIKECDDGSLHFTVPGIPGEFIFTKSSIWYRDGEKKGDGKREEKSYLLSGPPLLNPKHLDTDLLESLFCKSVMDPDVPDAEENDAYGKLKKRFNFLSLVQFQWLVEHRDVILNNPSKDFTRKRKATLTGTLAYFVGLGLRSIREFNKDIVDMEGDENEKEITEQAFGRNLDKFSEVGLGYLFALSAACLESAAVILGQNVYIMDGLHLTLRRGSFEPDKDAHCDTGNKEGYDSFNIVSLYDLGAHGFRDYQILKRAFANERNGLTELLDRNPGLSGIFLFDRGFPSYNVIYRMEQYREAYGAHYVARVPDTENVVRTLAPQYKDGSNTEWDLTRTVTIARTNSKELRSRFTSTDGSCVFVAIDKNTVFDAIPYGDRTTVCSMVIRIVHVKLTNPKTGKEFFETLITNTAYTLEELKNIYALRWKEEVAFKVLKQEAGLNHIHAVRMDRIAKEICARLYAYNLGATLVFSEEALKAVNTNAKKPGEPLKLKYRPNYSSVMCDLRKYLVGEISFDVLFQRMVRYKSAVRDGRTAPRSSSVNKQPRCVNAPAY